MQEAKPLNHVAKFHRTFQHPILENPEIPSEQRCRLRVNLIAEELKELEEAIADKDIVEIADALCDIQYVLSGAILEFGMGEKFSTLFDEVQRSNMSKACDTVEDAEATIEHYKKKDGSECFYEEKDGKYLVYRRDDMKTMKSINYSPADLKSIIEQ
ncbi:MAG: nucleoside triphosphate pyrophosphohydrolase family protein [Cyclobacteriaceae bacterium]